MSELTRRINYLLEKTGDTSFDVGMFINPYANREEFVISEYCSLHEDDEIVTLDDKYVTIAQVQCFKPETPVFHWLVSICGDHCFHFAKSRLERSEMFDWSDVNESDLPQMLE